MADKWKVKSRNSYPVWQIRTDTLREYEKNATAEIEARVWPKGPICPHCGTIGRCLKYYPARAALADHMWKCYACRKVFSVRHFLPFRHSHIHLWRWLALDNLRTRLGRSLTIREIYKCIGVSGKSCTAVKARLDRSPVLFPEASYDGNPVEPPSKPKYFRRPKSAGTLGNLG